MKTETYTNRYGDEFVFTLLEDGNIQWDGNFKHSRFGVANVYDDAYNEYKKDGGTLSMKEFIKEVHHYDEDTYKPSEIGKTYRELVYSDWDTITMVDPSGGPYLTNDAKIMGKVIKGFKPNDGGYIILTK